MASQSHEAFEPDWIVERFVFHLKCPRSGCGDPVIVAGDTHHIISGSNCEESGPEWSRVFQPSYFHPSPQVSAIASETPDPVANELRTAFSLLWKSPASATNRVRAAVEALLTDQGVKQFASSRGTRKRLTLHSRIELFQKQDEALGSRLMAAKWLGNDASHGDALTTDDALDSIELILDVIDQLYVRRAKRLDTLSKRVNARKGSARAKRRPRF